MSTQQIVSALMGIPWKDNNLKAKKTQEYLDWIKAASRGGRFTYHIGLSPQETFISSAIAALVHRDYEDGFGWRGNQSL